MPAGGQFAATSRGESTLTLAPAPLNAVQESVRSNLWNTARDLHPFAVDGVAPISVTEARARMREDVPAVSEEDFEHHFAEITEATRRSAEIANRADDPSTLDATYYINGYELADFPTEGYDPDDAPYDAEAWREKLVEEWDLAAFEAAGRLARHA
ncbi:hypothetical protein GCM10027273_09680 [Nocardioides pakistanensis]